MLIQTTHFAFRNNTLYVPDRGFFNEHRSSYNSDGADINYLHNWKCGSVIDAVSRTHTCLVPFSELSEEEKQKDIEAIESKIKK